MPIRVFEGMCDATTRWLQMFSPERKAQKDALWSQTTGANQYLAMRIVETGTQTVFLFAQCVHHFDPEAIGDPHVRHLLDECQCMAAHCALLTNDVYSLRKEVAVGQHRFNYVYIVMRQRELTVQQAVDYVIDEIVRRRARLMSLLSELRGHSSNMDKYLDNIYCIYEGHSNWIIHSARYNDNAN